MLMGKMTIEGVQPPPLDTISQAATPQSVVSTQAVVTQQVITAAGTLTTRPVVAPVAPPQVTSFFIMYQSFPVKCL